MNKLEKQLRERFSNNSLKLTTKIDFKTDGCILKIYIRHPDKNMQTDENAFEAWAHALKATGYDNIYLDWNCSNIKYIKHYNRFLYRVEKFKLFNPWFESVKYDCNHIFGQEVSKFINYGYSTVSRSSKGNKSENFFEEQLYTSKKFRDEHDIGDGFIERQLPVGIFTSNPPAEKNALFTGGASAIDLYGIDRKGTFHLFELKTDRNYKIGAFSEIFFYWCIINDVKAGHIKPTGSGKMRNSELTWDTIINSNKAVKNYLISSGRIHPIIKALCDEGQLGSFPLDYLEYYTCA